MTTQERALKFTRLSEGGYVNDPRDPGGETIFGVARKMNPQWSGWHIVDEIAKQFGRGTPRFIKEVESNGQLKALAKNLFIVRYWTPVHAGQFPDEIGIFLFDSAIHHGPFMAMKLLQAAVNNFHNKHKIPVDGYFGPITKTNVWEIYGKRVEYNKLIEECLRERWKFMKAIYNSNPKKWERFINGFRNRIYNLSLFLLGYKLDVGGW